MMLFTPSPQAHAREQTSKETMMHTVVLCCVVLCFVMMRTWNKQARQKWDFSRLPKEKGKKQKANGKPKTMPLPPNKKAAGPGGAAATAAYWDIVGETYLPPRSEVPRLKERAAWVAAECIDRAPEVI